MEGCSPNHLNELFKWKINRLFKHWTLKVENVYRRTRSTSSSIFTLPLFILLQSSGFWNALED